ncbi:MAG: hypothetical protein J6F31_09470 [Oscillospiraceae bacterium]|nr:hypothetical protein [Oscillospiraceae bacterium]
MYIYSLKDAAKAGKDAGGKAESLGRMINMHLPVPAGFVITSNAFEKGGIKKGALAELNALVKKLDPSVTYAVRSSAAAEDGKDNSFAGAYDTVTDVKTCDILDAVLRVVRSADNERAAVYASERNTERGRTAVVIQEFIRAEMAGVLFTADPVTANRSVMKGSFVYGDGEGLVSGERMDGGFTIDALTAAFTGSEEMEPYTGKLLKYALKLSSDMPVDIEFCIARKKLYLLQCRPITTLFKNDLDSFDINDSLEGEFLLSKTNVGEIFLRPVSPVTYSMLRNICETIGIPLISNICGQLYLNISGVCSMIMSLGVSKKKAFSLIKEIAGGIPDGLDIPVYRFDKKIIGRSVMNVIKSSFTSKKVKEYSSRNIKGHITEKSFEIIEMIHAAKSRKQLSELWENRCVPFMNGTLSVIMTGLSVKPLFTTREKLEKICGSDLTDRLLSDCSENGRIESLGPLLAIEDVAEGRMSREEYIRRYGHRHANEMELALPYPYEDPAFPENAIEEYRSSSIDPKEMKSAQEKRHRAALKEFDSRYPAHSAEMRKLLKKYSEAVYGRELIRSDALRFFCMIREYLKKAGELTGLGEDIFMLYIDEVSKLLKGDESCLSFVEKRRGTYEKQCSYPNFPNTVIGRFTVDEWTASGRTGGYYRFGESGGSESTDVICGIAGAVGQCEGVARVLGSIDEAETIEQGEILVVPAANIGWVKVFPRISGLVTDIGAPLSHAVIVARELGIPAVVSCQSAASQLESGDRIRIDGTQGKVYILERKAGTYAGDNSVLSAI